MTIETATKNGTPSSRRGRTHYAGTLCHSIFYRFALLRVRARSIVEDSLTGSAALLEWFYPRALANARSPLACQMAFKSEYREAELCASIEAWRAASALLRSSLEKGSKGQRVREGLSSSRPRLISLAMGLSPPPASKAHDDIRVLGNEVKNDEWREVTAEEVQLALHYVQRVLEDLYDDRPSVQAILIDKKRLLQP